jgi:hypothetical protein
MHRAVSVDDSLAGADPLSIVQLRAATVGHPEPPAVLLGILGELPKLLEFKLNQFHQGGKRVEHTRILYSLHLLKDLFPLFMLQHDELYFFLREPLFLD